MLLLLLLGLKNREDLKKAKAVFEKTNEATMNPPIIDHVLKVSGLIKLLIISENVSAETRARPTIVGSRFMQCSHNTHVFSSAGGLRPGMQLFRRYCFEHSAISAKISDEYSSTFLSTS